ncbi:hypothetical protein AB0H17_29620 [Streptomyces olivoreticuli]
MKQKKWWMIVVAAASLASLAQAAGVSTALAESPKNGTTIVLNDKGKDVVVTATKDATPLYVTPRAPKNRYELAEAMKIKKGDKVQAFCKFTVPDPKTKASETWYAIEEFFYGKEKDFDKATVPACPTKAKG